jgi:3-oxoacyl-(acyl-carrier-protein) synthase
VNNTRGSNSSFRVFLRGSALKCALGSTEEQIVSAIMAGHTPVSMSAISTKDYSALRPFYNFDTADADRNDPSPNYLLNLIFSSIQKAIDDAKLSRKELDSCALFMASTSRDISIYENLCKTGTPVHPFPPPGRKFASIMEECKKKFRISGPSFTIATACTSAANAIIYASSMIRTGKFSRALVAGYDVYNDTSQYGFESMMLISSPPYRPLDKNRSGIIMGEAVATVILDSQKPNAETVEILGGASLCDTYNITTHTSGGVFIAEGIFRALRSAGISKEDIHCVKAHATGTKSNDLTECNGLRAVFNSSMPLVTGLKAYMGHTVGAAGVAELLILDYCFKQGFIPATAGFSEPDEELAIIPLTAHYKTGPANVLLNFFGFGGNCASYIIHHPGKVD